MLALIEVEPGIGKTRLLEEFLRTTSVLVLRFVARELERSLPYQPLIEALRGLLRHERWNELRAELSLQAVWEIEIARLLPELAPEPGIASLGSPAPNESRLWEAFNQLLLALARRTPLILFV